jgi:dUTP pyrophosphatase
MKGIDVGAGVIDEVIIIYFKSVLIFIQDYRGNIGVILINSNDTPFEVKKGDRIAQLIIEKISTPEGNIDVLTRLIKTSFGSRRVGPYRKGVWWIWIYRPQDTNSRRQVVVS